jgi:prepilin-type N-terminal cleavage/methylation domain-containing protein
MKRERGFTIIEIIVAIIVLTVGLLGLVTSAALVTRMIARGQRSAAAAQYAARRLEMLRASGCRSQAGGSETLFRGSTPVDSLWWRFVSRGSNHWQVVVRSKYQTALGQWRTDSLETEISCLF